jgi:hypothetical protein
VSPPSLEARESLTENETPLRGGANSRYDAGLQMLIVPSAPAISIVAGGKRIPCLKPQEVKPS